MAYDLFIEPELHFEKVATETQLPDDPNAWPNEILDEIYKQVPYLADFDIDVNMDRVDAERGFGFGHVEVGNKTEAPQTASPQEQASAGIRKVRIPVIIRENRLQPFDVVVTDDSKMLPLTEKRLRQAIFRPQAFDVTSKSPGDQSMIGQLYPPYRQNYGFGGGGTAMNAGMGGKVASVLAALLPLANVSDVDAFKEAMLDSDLRHSMAKNAACHNAIELIAAAQPADLSKTANAMLHYIKPDVLQLSKYAGGYILKTASSLSWEPAAEFVDRGEAVRRCGEKIVLAADMTGAATVAEGEGVDEPEQAKEQLDLVESAGRYCVYSTDGNQIEGVAIPNLLDIDGTAKPIVLFTDGNVSAVQADLVGIPKGPIAEIQGLPAAQATGHGAFYTVEAGLPLATIPFDITSPYTDENGTTLIGSTFDGRPVKISIQPNIHTMIPFDGQVLIPDSWQWLPLDSTESVSLQGASDEPKLASISKELASVTVRAGDFNSFSISGHAVEKLAHEQKNFLSQDDALFVLASLGTNMNYAMNKLAEAGNGLRPVQVRIGRFLKTAEERRGESYIDASQYLSRTPSFRYQLWKEAAVIPDPVAVDTVLSLGFVNPENVAAFIGYLPVIDESQRRLCELLVASRLGMSHVPTPALEKAIRATEEVLEGLKEMAFQQ